ncbi:MAG: putative acetyltransferase EpsM [Candidatus Ordinivivax streblomastigis]|uniref:Putative acetyltransferase EpsM n=1 Tax=Candidatus Ordinivivax streblomastigis TaxID=2540710 RepID=A0A5M8P1X2_9BACT|nr:MAG: putative acetyltransferase EpsM [Candidatus Ordinivivax streblomastigis]
MKDIAIYGAGGLGKEIACLIQAVNREKNGDWNIIGYFDDGLLPGTRNRYGEVLGNIETLNAWDKPLSVVLALGKPQPLKQIAEKIMNPLIDFPNLLAPDLKWLDVDSVCMGKGNIVTFGCRISCEVKIGDFNILNGNVGIGHDVRIGSYNVMNPCTRISGETMIGDNNFFGVCSIVLQRKKIGNNITVSANSVVSRNTLDGCCYLGNPAKKIDLI